MTDNPYDKYYRDMNTPNSDDPFIEPEISRQSSDYYSRNNMGYERMNEPVYEPVAEDTAFAPSSDYGQTDPFAGASDTPFVQNASASYEWYGNSDPVAQIPEQHSAPEHYGYGYSNSNSKKPKEKGRMPIALLLLICMLVSTIFGGGSAFVVNYLVSNKNSSSSGSGITVNHVSPDSEGGSYSAEGEISTVDIVEKSADSVVEIITESVTTGIFSQQYIKSGAGSGVIIDSEGYIVTNHHVIESASKISVTLRNGETYDAKMIGSDAKEDLALLKIEAQNLTAAVMGDSETLRVGQRTIAIGNPLGQLGGTVTEGIISALDRELVIDGQTMTLMQTDTAINPGNSGGGMFDGKGNLIGIVVAKSSGSEVEGLGFAIPINDALTVISDLMEYGYVRGRVDIGIEFIDVTSEAVAWMYGLSETGCYVYKVGDGTNAEEAGLKSGDLVKKIDGKDVFSSDEIQQILDKKKVGDVVEFTVERNNRTGTINVTLEEDTPETFDNTDEDSDSIIPWFDFG